MKAISERRVEVLRNLIAKMADKAGDRGLQNIANNAAAFEAAMNEVVARFARMEPAFGNADEVLGDNFFPPSVVGLAWGLAYTPDQLETFERTAPDPRVLERMRENGYVLVAGPPRPLSIIQIHADKRPCELYQDCFEMRIGWWYVTNEQFVRKETVGPQWYAIQKHRAPGDSLVDGETVSTAVERVWAMLTFKRTTSEKMDPHGVAWTASMGPNQETVTVTDHIYGIIFKRSRPNTPRENLGALSAKLTW